MPSKFESLMGFAARSGSIVTGYNTCLSMIRSRRIALLILAEDIGENTREKMMQKCASNGVQVRTFGKAEELSHMTGRTDKKTFGITDKDFAKSICREIDLFQSERKVAYGKESI